jgi:hypothetical protein
VKPKTNSRLFLVFLVVVFTGSANCRRFPAQPTHASRYPLAVDASKVGKYPMLTKSGGGYFYDDVLEYRVWINPPEGGDDYYKAFASYEEAETFANGTTGADKPLVLVLQKEWIEEPQPGVFVRRREDRITEWQVSWLDKDKRTPEGIESFLQQQKLAADLRAPLVEITLKELEKFSKTAGLSNLKSANISDDTTEVRLWRGGGLFYPISFVISLQEKNNHAYLVTVPNGKSGKYEQKDVGTPRSGWESFIEQLNERGIYSAVWFKLDETIVPNTDEGSILLEVKRGKAYSFVFYLESTKSEDGKKAFEICRMIEGEFQIKLGCRN